MRREVAIDISQNTELLRLVEEVRASGSARVLTNGSEPVAVLRPVQRRRTKAVKECADREAFLSSLGSWADVDTEALKQEIKQARSDHRPPVEL
jgi:antitoxin (DNA-binding transcriptional repressor) of toxin-antitoxin stability system